MAQYIPEILLWLFVINHGIAFGAGLYELIGWLAALRALSLA